MKKVVIAAVFISSLFAFRGYPGCRGNFVSPLYQYALDKLKGKDLEDAINYYKQQCDNGWYGACNIYNYLRNRK